MKIILLALILAAPVLASAHCPVEIKDGADTYCAFVEWGLGEKKVKGNFVEVMEETPYMVPMQTVPQKWVYSKAFISLWRKGDPDHKPVHLQDFKIFPFMVMQTGHSHSTSYSFGYVESVGVYEISEMGLLHMPGCWSLRWTFGDVEDVEGSNLFGNIKDYKNLSEKQNEMMFKYCEAPLGGGHKLAPNAAVKI